MKNLKKITLLLVCIILMFPFSLNTMAHSGRTDSSGGHHDYKNKSGLGSYHYHHGCPPHLHPNGVCPYAPKDKITVSGYDSTMCIGDNQSFEYDIESTNSYVYPSITSSDDNVVSVNGKSLTAKKAGNATITIETSTATKSFNITVKEVYAEDIEISVPASELQVGSNMTINGTVSPSNTTDKAITYNSSNDEIATVSSSGEIKGVSPGTVTITATTSNKISKEIDINIFEVYPEGINCEDSIKMIIGDTYALSIGITPKNANNKQYTIASDNKDVLQCKESKLEALKEGRATLHIETWNGIKKDIPVQVDIIPVEKIKIQDSTEYITSNVIDKSDKILLATEITPNNATYQDVTWESSNDDIVSVQDNNFIVNGTGKVTLSCVAHNGTRDSVEVVVIDKGLIEVAFASVVVFFGGTVIVIMIKRKKSKKTKII